MAGRAETLARAAALRAAFEAAGAVPVETPILQPAETLLDLYGEDIRARAYVTSDALHGEQMLRPDFTVPVVQMHMAHGADPARYTYAGEVFRRQEHDPDRASEYIQVGYEVFDRASPATSDAEVFALISGALSGIGVTALTGDIGILMSAIDGLDTTDRRKAALSRHVWRPGRFRALLDRYAGRVPVPAARAALLAMADPLGDAGPEIGARSRGEIADRIEALRADAETPPLDARQIAALDSLLSIRDTAPAALRQLRGLTGDLPAISRALDRLEARIAALAERGVDVASLAFETSYGRGSMEYYDGFVFGFAALGRADLPLVASGGRYDALTRRLGQGAEIPAVGGVLRPGLMLDLEGAEGMSVKLGVPSKGRLMEQTFEWFAARGVTLARTGSDREYSGAVSGIEGIDLVLVSAGEVPRDLAAGRLHLGVTGTDLVHEKLPLHAKVVEPVAAMGFGHADLILAVPQMWVDVDTLDDLDAVAAAFRARHGRRLRIATKYHRLVRDFLRAAGVADYVLIDSQGATEGTVKNEIAEAIADITSSGETLRANHLKVLSDGLILQSEATLWQSSVTPCDGPDRAALDALLARLRA